MQFLYSTGGQLTCSYVCRLSEKNSSINWFHRTIVENSKRPHNLLAFSAPVIIGCTGCSVLSCVYCCQKCCWCGNEGNKRGVSSKDKDTAGRAMILDSLKVWWYGKLSVHRSHFVSLPIVDTLVALPSRLSFVSIKSDQRSTLWGWYGGALAFYLLQVFPRHDVMMTE